MVSGLVHRVYPPPPFQEVASRASTILPIVRTSNCVPVPVVPVAADAVMAVTSHGCRHPVVQHGGDGTVIVAPITILMDITVIVRMFLHGSNPRMAVVGYNTPVLATRGTWDNPVKMVLGMVAQHSSCMLMANVPERAISLAPSVFGLIRATV
jgi:hypothetical protein